MDTIDVNIAFDSRGFCNHCNNQIELVNKLNYSSDNLQALIKRIKCKSNKSSYDVIIGVSGGVDSAYALHLIVKLGLKPLAVHVDAGWNSNIAVSNIERMCSLLEVDLETIIVDWNSMKLIQRAFFLSGSFNLDIPQDHAFLSGVYKFAKSNKIKFMVTGLNFQTEGISPKSNLGYDPIDLKFIKSILKEYGDPRLLKNIPHMALFEYLFLQLKVEKINILNFIDYKRSFAIKTLKELYEWQDYGDKHHESLLTRFLQTSYLIDRFNYDKRIMHYSSLIINDEIDRDVAIKEIEIKSNESRKIELEKKYILTKLGLTENDYIEIINSKFYDHKNYPNNEVIINLLIFIKSLFLRVKYKLRNIV